MRSRRTARFKSLFEELPADIRERGARTCCSIGIPHTPVYSSNICETLLWYWIGPHAECDRLISQLK
jgi:hypothetical protein